MTVQDVRPEAGQVWRERRRQYALRTVLIVAVDDDWPAGFVYIRTITNTNGERVQQRAKTRVRQRLWHPAFEPDSL